MAGKGVFGLALFALLTTGTFYLLNVSDEPLYSRQECIQKVVFNWDDRSVEEVEEVIANIAATLRNEWGKDLSTTTSVPDFSFPYAHRNELYLQYREACDQKKSQATHLIEQRLKPVIPQLPGYVITDEQIIPSPRTIDVTGEWWMKDTYQ